MDPRFAHLLPDGFFLDVDELDAAERHLRALGWIAADVKRIDTGGDPAVKIPHIGWTDTIVDRSGDILPDDDPDLRFYYVHSYRAVCDDPAEVLCSADYGSRFTSGFVSGNLRGVQFHPEKSHRFGMELFRRWLGIAP